MTSHKHLKGVAHDIAHHAASSLSYLPPHLSEVCRVNFVASVVLDITHDPKYPEGFFVSEPLELATKNLKEWYLGFLIKKGFDESDIQSVTIEFTFLPRRTDEWCESCRCRIVSSLGKEYSASLLFSGIKFNCPSCKKSLESPQETAGQVFNCPNCRAIIEIPSAFSFRRRKS